jgi:hypothetical protein
MEAASGGYAEVGRVLLDKGADVNAPPVPSSRDTALTIAADKGHYKFCELLIGRYDIIVYCMYEHKCYQWLSFSLGGILLFKCYNKLFKHLAILSTHTL